MFLFFAAISMINTQRAALSTMLALSTLEQSSHASSLKARIWHALECQQMQFRKEARTCRHRRK